MDFGANKTPVEVITPILETFILVLLESGAKNHGKHSIRSFIVQIIMMSVLINMVLSVDHH